MKDDLARKIAAEVGATVEEVKLIIKIVDDFRLEEGEEAYRRLVADMGELIETAKADGVSPEVLMDAMKRRLS